MRRRIRLVRRLAKSMPAVREGAKISETGAVHVVGAPRVEGGEPSQGVVAPDQTGANLYRQAVDEGEVGQRGPGAPLGSDGLQQVVDGGGEHGQFVQRAPLPSHRGLKSMPPTFMMKSPSQVIN